MQGAVDNRNPPCARRQVCSVWCGGACSPPPWAQAAALPPSDSPLSVTKLRRSAARILNCCLSHRLRNTALRGVWRTGDRDALNPLFYALIAQLMSLSEKQPNRCQPIAYRSLLVKLPLSCAAFPPRYAATTSSFCSLRRDISHCYGKNAGTWRRQ
jgi:hypothetical protein